VQGLKSTTSGMYVKSW